jgi:hypothetical protein
VVILHHKLRKTLSAKRQDLQESEQYGYLAVISGVLAMLDIIRNLQQPLDRLLIIAMILTLDGDIQKNSHKY